MTDAVERGDLDEASRQGVLAGPLVVEAALGSPSRTTRLAAITASVAVEARGELLPALATQAGRADRRTAIPAALAARTIARELANQDLPDDIDPDDITTDRALFEQLARNGNRFIEVRVLALDTAASLGQILDPQALAFDLKIALADPDPALRAAAVQLVPAPTPAMARAALAYAVTNDADPRVALGAAQALCDDRIAAQAALGGQGLARIKQLIAGATKRTTRLAARCLAK